jgi:hypothetical protein
MQTLTFFTPASVITMSTPTPRHSNQSFKYQRVEEPFPVEVKSKSNVGKVLCFQREKDTPTHIDTKRVRAGGKSKTNPKERKRHSDSGVKLKVKDMVVDTDYPPASKGRINNTGTAPKPPHLKSKPKPTQKPAKPTVSCPSSTKRLQ